MLQISKNKVIIDRKKWDDLKKDNYFKDFVDVLEESEELKQAKKGATSFIRLRDYISNREKRDNNLRQKALSRGKRPHV